VLISYNQLPGKLCLRQVADNSALNIHGHIR
jgi:hypothetical protein